MLDWKQWDKSLRRRVIAMAIVAAFILLAFILRLAQFQLFGGGDFSRYLDASSSQQEESGQPDSSKTLV